MNGAFVVVVVVVVVGVGVFGTTITIVGDAGAGGEEGKAVMVGTGDDVGLKVGNSVSKF